MPSGLDLDTEMVMSISAVDAEFDEVAGHLNALHGRLVALVEWMLANTAEWQGDGLWTPEQYLALRLGIAPGVAKKLVDIARAASDFPDCVGALRRGELSVDQVAPVVRNAPAWADRQMAGLAPRCTVAQVSKIARRYQWDDAAAVIQVPDAADESVANLEPEADASTVTPDDSCWWGYDDSGRFRLWLETDQERGEVIESALNEANDALFRINGSPPSGVDIVSELAERSLSAVPSDSRRNRYRVNMHIRVDGSATDGRGRGLPASIAQHISCDGIVAPVFVEAGRPISVGRSQHIVPERTRRTVERRDGGCRVPGCSRERFVEVHHIVHWSEHGQTNTPNLIALCPAHHRLHHRGRLGIFGDADEVDGVSFVDAHGCDLLDRVARPQPPVAPPPAIEGNYEHPLGERLEMRWLYFNDDPDRPRRTTTPARSGSG